MDSQMNRVDEEIAVRVEEEIAGLSQDKNPFKEIGNYPQNGERETIPRTVGQ